MGLNFRKSIKVADGVKINIGKKSAGVSLGGKYGGVSLNTKTGASVHASAPGTGVSYSKRLGSKKKGKSKSAASKGLSSALTVLLIAIAVAFVIHKNWDTISDKLGLAPKTEQTTPVANNTVNEATGNNVVSSGTVTYILNTNTKKIHKQDCRYAGTGDNFKETTDSLDSLLNSGYEKCKTCMK